MLSVGTGKLMKWDRPQLRMCHSQDKAAAFCNLWYTRQSAHRRTTAHSFDCTSSQYYSQSIGLVEAAVRTAKMLQLKRAVKANQDQWWTSHYPLLVVEYSRLPEYTYRGNGEQPSTTTDFDQGCKELPEMEIGQPIRMATNATEKAIRWRRGVCITKVAPRSYIVEVDGSV